MHNQNSKMILYPKTIQEGNQEKIARLLKKGADIDSIDKDRKTALWWASFNGNLPLVKFLVGQKANVSKTDKNGKTAYDIANEMLLRSHEEASDSQGNYLEIVKLLAPILGIDKITENIANLSFTTPTSNNNSRSSKAVSLTFSDTPVNLQSVFPWLKIYKCQTDAISTYTIAQKEFEEKSTRFLNGGEKEVSFYDYLTQMLGKVDVNFDHGFLLKNCLNDIKYEKFMRYLLANGGNYITAGITIDQLELYFANAEIAAVEQARNNMSSYQAARGSRGNYPQTGQTNTVPRTTVTQDNASETEWKCTIV